MWWEIWAGAWGGGLAALGSELTTDCRASQDGCWWGLGAASKDESTNVEGLGSGK